MPTPVRLASVPLLSTQRSSIDLGGSWLWTRRFSVWRFSVWRFSSWGLSARRRERRVGRLRASSDRGSWKVAAGTHLRSRRLASGGVGAPSETAGARR
ncbi:MULTISPECIES: hypothetical protein [unclassified Gordonia (in: high G+C Gram-positive bacteria)]